MPKVRFSKRSKVPRKPFDRDRLIDELKLVGYYGLKNKRELWTMQKICDSTKTRARDLLISPNENLQIEQGRDLLKKLVSQGILPDIDFQLKSVIIQNLNNVLNLTEADWLERRLQFRVAQMGIARNVHEARCMIYHKHISIGGCVVNKPGYMVNANEEAKIEIYQFSSKADSKKKSRREKKAIASGGDNGDDDE